MRSSHDSSVQSRENPSGYNHSRSSGDRQTSATNESPRPSGQRIEEMPWDKQPAYGMGKQSGAWGSDKNRNKAPDTRSNHSSGRLRYLERQLVDQRKALRQLEEE